MNDVSVIDRFLEVFGLYIDTGFGLLGGEVAFLTMTLVVIDMTLAGLFWAMGGEDVSAKLIRKTLYVGAFAFIIGNFNALAKIVFNSFAGLGLLASGSGLSHAEFLQPGRLAAIGVDAGAPSGAAASGAPTAPDPVTAPTKQPDWAWRLQRRQQLSQATSTVAHTLRGGDGGGSSPARVAPSREGYINAIQVWPYSDGALYQVYASPGRVTAINLQPGEELTPWPPATPCAGSSAVPPVAAAMSYVPAC